MFDLTRSFILKSAKKRQPFRALFLVLSLLLIFVGGNAAHPTTAAPLLTCADITEIPATECQALEAFVTANPSADVLATWFQTNTPCSWANVNCGSSNTVTSLNLDGYVSTNRLTTVPAEIGNLSNLTFLNLYFNGLTSVPAEIWTLTNLTSLNLYCNQLTTVPAEIGNLTNLTSLNLGGSGLTSVPAEIWTLTNLTSLTLSNNQLTSVPAEIGNLINLTTLSLSINQLITLPAEIWTLTNLTSLDLDRTQLTSVPAEIGNLTNLTSLYLRDNQLTSVPAEIGNLANLTELHIYLNQLTSVPAEIGNLANLTWLALSHNQLTSLPAEIGNLTNLTYLDLTSNQLTSVPAEIWTLTNLTSLYLGVNQLTSVPAEIWTLTNLTSLNLGGNQLTVVPAEIGNLTNLIYLGLGGTQLTSVPAEIGNLIHLTNLYLNNTQLTSLPSEIGNLANLTELYLIDNANLKGVVPSNYLNLQKLTMLHLYNTQLCIPDEPAYQSWIATIGLYSPGVSCAQLTPTPTATNTPLPTATNTPLPTATNTPLPTATNTPLPTATNTPLPTATNTPLPTATSTPLPTATITPLPTATNTPLPTATNTPVPSGDSYEADDSCSNAKSITTNGAEQSHTFHDAGDADWVKFTATADSFYQIIGDVSDSSPVDLSLELYSVCNDPAPQRPRYAFGVGVQMLFVAPADGTYYLKLSDNNPSTFGNNATYQLSVRELNANPEVGAVIIVGGRLKLNDRVQRNIHNVTNSVYRMYREQGFTDDQIFYFATDLGLTPRTAISYVDGLATKANVQDAIVNLVKTHVSSTKALTLYLMSHGDEEKFYLDNVNNEVLSPTDLNSWLTTLESAVPGLKVNVVIDACHSGSFIEPDQSISKPNRVIISSAQTVELAYATHEGAEFSDLFLTSLREGRSVSQSFVDASDRVWRQTPWLDSNGNGTPNESEDYDIASQRGFGSVGSFGADNEVVELWRPYIPEPAPVSDTAGTVTLGVTVQNDNDQDTISEVLAVLYPPSYVTPTEGGELIDISTYPTITLQSTGGDNYEGSISLSEIGEYQAVIYAKDSNGLVSRPKTIQFTNTKINLPTAVQAQDVDTTRVNATVMALFIVVGLGGASAVLLSKRRRA